MSQQAPGRRQRWGAVLRSPWTVLGVALALVGAQLGLRAWAVAGGWFLGEDLLGLADLTGPVAAADLVDVRADHLSPVAGLLTWLLAASTPYDWALATLLVVGLTALADLAALVFVVRLVGLRWLALVPLGWYLLSVVTLPASMWWSSAVIQLPLQVAVFGALTAHLEHLRSGRRRFALLAWLALAVGMACDVGIVYTVVPLLFLSLYFSDGRGVRGRLAGLWRQRLVWGGYVVLLAGYVAVYLRLRPPEQGTEGDAVRTALLLARESLLPVLVGGPWRWGPPDPTPLVPAEAPAAWVAGAMVLAALGVLLAWRRRRATAWVLAPVGLLAGAHAGVLTATRGAFPAEVLAHEVRYLAVLAPMLVLALAVLVAGPAPARPEPWVPRPVPAAGGPAPARPRWRRAVPVVAGVAVVGGFVAGSLVSTLEYAAAWHGDFPTRVYVRHVQEQSVAAPLRIVDQPVPPAVVPPQWDEPERTRPSWVFRPLGARVLASLEGNDLLMLDEEGLARPAEVRPLVASAPAPADGCGYRVGPEEGTSDVIVPLAPVPGEDPVPELWWGSVGYLASADGRMGIAVGDELRTISVRRGLHRYVWLGRGTPQAAARLVSLSDTEVCVDQVSAGSLAIDEEEGG